MNIFTFIRKGWGWTWTKIYHCQYKNIHRTARVQHSAVVLNPDNLYMEELTNIDADAMIMNTRAKFIMRKWSGAAFGLTVVTGNHLAIVGKHLKQVTNEVKDELDNNGEMDKDIVVEEDVWIGSRVTLLSGVTIGRGSEVGSGSVVRGSIPPYSVVIGNPAKIVGFRFTPDEIVEHEENLYDEESRLPKALLDKNYEKYFLSRIKDIKQYLKL